MSSLMSILTLALALVIGLAVGSMVRARLARKKKGD